jgi:hypothetical protein
VYWIFMPSFIVYLFCGLSLLTLKGFAEAESTVSAAYDCTVVQLEAVDESTLTKAERIARMDQVLLDSIDQYDNCLERLISSNAAGGSGGAGAGEGSGGTGEAGAGEGSGGTGEAGAGQSGTGEGATTATGNEDGSQSALASTEASSTDASQNNDPAQTNNASRSGGNSGAKNQEIGSRDNDAAVCQLLKEELATETDPKKQAELKEIFHNYRCR